MYIKKMIGDKCFLSTMNSEDAEQYAVWLNDLEVVNYLTLSSAVITIDGEKEALKDLSARHNYSIIDSATNKLIGSVGLENVDHINQTAEIGIFIGNKSYWNKGYGQEALSLLLDYAYKHLNLHTILLRAYSFNDRAVACYEKIGFRKIGEEREALARNLKYYNIVYMDILPNDFYKKNPKYRVMLEKKY